MTRSFDHALLGAADMLGQVVLTGAARSLLPRRHHAHRGRRSIHFLRRGSQDTPSRARRMSRVRDLGIQIMAYD